MILIDIVTSRQANLHDEMMHLMGHGESFKVPATPALYAVAYRPLVRDGREQSRGLAVPLGRRRVAPRAPAGAERGALSAAGPRGNLYGRLPATTAGLSGLSARNRSPVDPLVRRIGQLDFLLADVPLVAAADEVDAQGLVLDRRLAALGVGDLLVAVGEAADVDAEAVGLRVPLVPDRGTEDGVIDAFLGARAG